METVQAFALEFRQILVFKRSLSRVCIDITPRKGCLSSNWKICVTRVFKLKKGSNLLERELHELWRADDSCLLCSLIDLA